MKFAISMTCYKRAEYLKQVLDSIKKSIEYCKVSVPLYISIDYYDNTIVDYISSIDWTEVNYRINRPSVGCNLNTLLAMEYVCSNDINAFLHLEDDTVLAKDAISYYLQALKIYETYPTVLSVAGYNKNTVLPHISDLDMVMTHKSFSAWGCAFWKSKIQTVFDNWIPVFNRNNGGMSWDSYLNEYLYKKLDYYEIKPIVSRIQNIGAEQGTWVPNASWHYENHRTPYTSEDLLTDK